MPVVRRVAVMAALAAGVEASLVAGAALHRADGMAVSGGMLPAGRGAGAGGFPVAGSLTQLLPPARTHIATFTTAPTTTPITTPITGFQTPINRGAPLGATPAEPNVGHLPIAADADIALTERVYQPIGIGRVDATRARRLIVAFSSCTAGQVGRICDGAIQAF